MPGTYNPLLVALSFLVAILSSYSALELAARMNGTQDRASRMWLAAGSFAIGLGIWAVHLIGMLALRLPTFMYYQLSATLWPLAFALLASGFALQRVSGHAARRREVIVGTLLMTLGLLAVFVTGASALTVSPSVRYDTARTSWAIGAALATSLTLIWSNLHLRAFGGRTGVAARMGAALIVGACMAGTHYTAMSAISFDAQAVWIGGTEIDSEWPAAMLGILTCALLIMTLMQAVFDAQMRKIARQHVSNLERANVELEGRVTARTRELQDLYDHAPCGYHTLDANGIFLRMNQTELQWLGYTEEEVVGKMHLGDIHTSANRERLMRNLNEVIRTGGPLDAEYDYVRKDGSTIAVAIQATALRDEERGFVACLVTVHDITARKEADRILRHTGAFLDSVIEAIPMTLYVKDARDLKYLRFNRTGESTFGVTRDQVIGKTDAELFAPAVAQRLTERDRALIANQKPLALPSVSVAMRDGSLRSMRTINTTIGDEQGHPLYLLGIAEDVTESLHVNAELKRKTEEANAANRAKSAFLATMSHEIRTPMNGVLGVVELLGRSALDSEQQDLIQTARESAAALLDIIDDVLDFSKIEAGRLELENDAVSLRAVVETAGEALAAIADKSDVQLLLYCDPLLPERIRTDATRLRQILLNLGGNALKFATPTAGRRGTVSISAKLVERSAESVDVLLKISDNGIGMTEEVISTLFRPFVQAESSTTRRFGGTGLGLSISQHIAQAMGARIEVASEPGQGSVFSMQLRFDLEAPAETHDIGVDLSELRVIVLCDQPVLRDIVTDYLESSGASVATYDDGEHGHQRALQMAAELGRRGADPVIVIVTEGDAGGEFGVLQKGFSRVHSCGTARCVVLTQGRRRRGRLLSCDAVVLDSNALRRSALLRAVAVAAGIVSPEVEAGRLELPVDALKLPSIGATAQVPRILVAEDNPTNRKVIGHQLAVLGHPADMADNGTEALQRWKTGRYELVLTDCHMPEMDGFQLTSGIRALEVDTGRRVPIVAITANALKGEADRCIRAGMDDYLTKPISLDRLRVILEKWLKPLTDADPGVDARPIVRSTEAGAPSDAASLVQVHQEVINPADLIEALGSDDSMMLREFYGDFVISTRDILRLMADAQQQRSSSTLVELAHRLKSSAGTVGARELARCAIELEQVGRGTDWQKIDGIYGELVGHSADAMDWIEKYNAGETV